ncbi:hypothetical protein ACELLULO517_15780 [Acidisoma cellulosilytica]|uniref:Uncharacterized protein n=1 Tax=Acidisoma cellulosilyticum TaxID=2802395 RepID=A0A963Z4P0_9PROT|nr:hypothetical protein [Acidisoma cellulosilyticum]MCB8881708.1 hypothetical protein [Acidisoma cellulosilyticum]
MSEETEGRRFFDSVKAICEDPRFSQSVFLVHHGIPFDIAFGTDAYFRTALYIKMCEIEGSKFDFDTMEFQKPEA